MTYGDVMKQGDFNLRRLAAGKEDFLLSHSIRVLVPQRGRPSRKKEEAHSLDKADTERR
jgi:hypothetical protein